MAQQATKWGFSTQSFGAASAASKLRSSGPNLNPLDYLFCNYAIIHMHRQKPGTIDELKKTVNDNACTVPEQLADDPRHGGQYPQKVQYLLLATTFFFMIPIKTVLNSLLDVTFTFFSMNHSF